MVTRPHRIAALALAASLAAPVPARADARAIADARAAIKQVKYDRAQALLVAALRAGDSTPAELAELLELAGTTALVLGQRDVADQYFRQLLAIAPDATLPAGVSPKLRDAFVAAQAAMAALGRLDVRATATADGEVVVELVRDPLQQVVAIAAVTAAGAGAAEPLTAGRATIPAAGLVALRVLDVHGNQLRVIDAAAVAPPPVDPLPMTPPVEPVAPPAPTPITPPQDSGPDAHARALDAAPHPTLAPPRRPWLRAWPTWAVPAALAAGVGIGFTVAAQASRDERDRLRAEPGGQFTDEYEAAVAAAEDRQLVGNLAFVATGVIAATGAILVLTWSPPARATVVPTASSTGAGAALRVTW